ncbi:hypothetical protein N431DRAFT_488965 [Stipitochalara longipes BDJ]|nr:hypothetical protein N431DRAFT_488965 [Stipitochalara longipes BDJ]
MDPLTALSVAASVVQFVDFTFKVLSDAHQLYENGELSVHEQTSKVAHDLASFSRQLRKSIRDQNSTAALTENELELDLLCRECASLSSELITKLENLKPPARGHPWESVGHALKSMWSRKDLNEVEVKLSKYRDAMNSRLLGSLRERVDRILKEQALQNLAISNNTEKLITHTEKLVASALLDIHGALARNMQEQSAILNSLSARMQAPKISDTQDPITTDILKRSQDIARNDEEAKVFLSIQYEEAQRHKRIADLITKSLRYEKLDERFETVTEAHRKTFEWILQPRQNDGEVIWSDFVQWLREGDDLFWITGKPGSGKTTLMKFIYENPATEEHLRVWAKDTPLYVSGFFFWWAGTEKQKSQEGLLRTLLYSLLRQMPILVPYVFPSQWAAQYASETGLKKISYLDVHQKWSLGVLKKGFQRLITQREIPMKLCLFIDGLDEYEGRETDIADLFKDVVLSPQVKVCVSSRPQVAFESAFDNRPRIRMQDLTSQDIQLYLEDQLVHDGLMENLSRQEPEACAKLVEEIGQAAQGVFLWVELVVKSLLNGLSNQDRIEDLLKRLKALPRGLAAFYEHIVINIDNIYQEEASRLYQLMAVTLERPDDWYPAQKLSLVSMYLSTHQEELNDREFVKAFQDKDFVLRRCKETDIFLRTRCGGLLELEHGLGSTKILPSLRVTYIHRTVMEYLEERAIRRQLLDRTRGTGQQDFDPNLAVVKALCFQFSLNSSLWIWLGDPIKASVLTHARRVDQNKNIPESDLVRIFDDICPALRWESMIPIAIQGCMTRYLREKLKESNLITGSQTQRPLLDIALVPTPESERFIRPEVITLLLSFGAKPNRKFEGQSPWQRGLSYLVTNHERLSVATLQFWTEIIRVMLENGANPLTECQGPERFDRRGKTKKTMSLGNLWTAEEVIRRVYSNSGESLRLQALLKDKSRSEKKSKCHQQ